ncbi:unnamed protein product [Prorocentrum cordatum]|uniref:Uncharacterized protein n=1 Tax=Prorocentrum cordatum TaxID=2364126 RepID=A0ABN9PWQ8_9DINO|nr:unnamed protein product [Polarella glacialis]
MQSPTMVTMEKANLIFGGNAKPFKQGFETRGVPGGYGPSEASSASRSSEFGGYFRVAKDVDIGAGGPAENFKSILVDVLKESPVVVKVKGHAFDSKGVSEWRTSIGEISRVRWSA